MLAIILIITGIGLDQLTKYLTVSRLKGNPAKIIIENVLRFTYVENRGAAFGILQDQRLFFVIITLITLAVLGGFLIKYYKTISTWMIVAISLVISGTIGNFIDRIRLGYVVDFISVRILDRYDFAVFNIADSLIVIGGIMLIISIMFADSSYEKNKI